MFTQTQRRPEAWKYEPVRVAGKRIIVTGGTSGIGRTTALLLASLGAEVLIFGRHEQKLREALDAMGDCRERVFGLTADVSKEDDVDRVFQEADDKLGGLDALINNAGLPARSVLDTDPAEYRYVIETNLVGSIACTKRAVPRLKQQGGGSLIYIGSLSAKSRGAESDLYTTTKMGLRGFCDSLAKQVQQDNITVSLIEPGRVGAGLTPLSPEEEQQKQAAGTLLFSECIAEAVLYCLIQPAGCVVPLLQIQPLHQVIGG